MKFNLNIKKYVFVGGDHGSGEVLQELLKPVHAFSVEVVGRFVEKEHIRFRQQQAAQSHTALFTAGKIADLGIPGRQAKCVSSNFHLCIGVGTAGRDDGFQTSLLGS